jgi:P4 family phage/plasmid primase-like protien
LNVFNGELTFDEGTGNATLQPHDPAHWQTTLLPVDYRPEAECPRFDLFLREIFKPLADRDAMIEYLWELIGYTIQPTKDIAAWVLLTGDGSNGKTTLLEIIRTMLGEHAIAASIPELVNNDHGMAMLPGALMIIDEDLNKDYRLPDGFLKKVSENKTLSANPKFEHPFQFENQAIIWMAANAQPRSRDLSHGMIRRAHVVPFRRIFSVHEQDHGLKRYIVRHELPGILAGAVRGLQRLRARGYFEKPESASMVTTEWSSEASPLGLWAADSLEPIPGVEVKLSSAYAHYRQWAADTGHDKKSTLHSFGRALRDAKVQTPEGKEIGRYEIKRRATGNALVGYRLRHGIDDCDDVVPF